MVRRNQHQLNRGLRADAVVSNICQTAPIDSASTKPTKTKYLMSKLTLDEAAMQYAWELGRGDFPAADQCPYSADKSRKLHAAYWQGWQWALRKRGGEDAIRQTAA